MQSRSCSLLLSFSLNHAATFESASQSRLAQTLRFAYEHSKPQRRFSIFTQCNGNSHLLLSLPAASPVTKAASNGFVHRKYRIVSSIMAACKAAEPLLLKSGFQLLPFPSYISEHVAALRCRVVATLKTFPGYTTKIAVRVA